ncbi:MAG: hypothetical protein R3245_08855 [Kiloniellales bacterium]|nr:hypothetical protein [Kiloniellales bacterium]
MFKKLAIGGLFFALTASAASAQPQCDERDKVLSLLSNKYKESPVAIGVTNNGGLVEVLSTNEGTTWSIIVTTPNGVSCLVAAGEGWRALQQAAADPET